MLRKILFVFIVTIMCVNTMFAQGDRVTGTVKDEFDDLLTGASVVVKGTSNGMFTDIDGKYSLNQVSTGSILVFSYIGYETQEIRVSDNRTIDEIGRASCRERV